MENRYTNWILEHIKTKKITPIDKAKFRVGRAKGLDLVCESINVSRNHADIIICIDGSLNLIDNNASNGTYINRRMIPKYQISIISEGDEIGFGSHSTMEIENEICVYIVKRTDLNSEASPNNPIEVPLPTCKVDDNNAVSTITLRSTSNSDPINFNLMTKRNRTISTSSDESVSEQKPNLKKLVPSSSNTENRGQSLPTLKNSTNISSINNIETKSLVYDYSEELLLGHTATQIDGPSNTESSHSASTSLVTIKQFDAGMNSFCNIQANSSSHNNSAGQSLIHLPMQVGDSSNTVPAKKLRTVSTSFENTKNINSFNNVRSISLDNSVANDLNSSGVNCNGFIPTLNTATSDICTSSHTTTTCISKPHNLNDFKKLSSKSTSVVFQNSNSKMNICETTCANDMKTTNMEQSEKCDYLVDMDGCIVIDSETEDDTIIKQELVHNNDNYQSFVSDTLFCNVKRELEGLDSYDDNYLPTYNVDSDTEPNQEWADIFQILESQKSPVETFETELNKRHSIPIRTKDNYKHAITGKEVTSTGIPNSMVINTHSDIPKTKVTVHIENIKNKAKEKTFKIPPVVAPHYERRAETRNGKRKSSNSLSNIPHEEIKKIKTNRFYCANDKKALQTIAPVENMQEMRKQKLKEIAEKSQNGKNERKVIRGSTAKIKMSNGRGTFLETPCEPSTSKAKPSTLKKPIKNSTLTKPPVLQNKSKTSNNGAVIPVKAIETNGTYTINNLPPVASTHHAFIRERNIKQLNGYKGNEHSLLIKDVLDVILEMLTWDVKWFYNNQVPNLSKKPLQRMNKSFTSYSEYYNIVFPLLMVELWNFFYKEVDLTFKSQLPYNFTIQKETLRKKFIELDIITTMPKDKVLKQGDVVTLQLFVETYNSEKEPFKLAVLGYVVDVFKKNLNANGDFPDKQSLQDVTVNAQVMIQYFEGTLNKDKNLRLQYLTSLTTSTRTFKSIKYLEKSPLCHHILRPNFELFKVPSSPNAELYLKEQLNNEQMAAVSEASNMCLLNKPCIYLIHGPPGTGKTSVIINIILALALSPKNKDTCVLVTAPTNAAVDELASRIIAAKTKLQDNSLRSKLSMVRVGPQSSIKPEIQDYSLYESGKRTLVKDLLRHESIENRRKLRNVKDKHDYWKSEKNQPNAHNRIKKLFFELEEVVKEILGNNYYERIKECENSVLRNARIICTTLSSCASVKMSGVFSGKSGRICCCIIDEATQSTEQETLIPLILGVDKLVLVGDPKQLPALSFAQESKKYGFGQSLFSRIDSNFKGASYNPIKFLNVQYRMHPAVCLFPNKEFYDGKLKNAPMLFNRKSPLTRLKPYLVFNFQGESDNNEEYRNQSEITCVMLLLEKIVSNIPESCKFSIGIITPYNDQKDGILQDIRKKTFRKNAVITVNTVDSFQGRENDIIIMSCVRYNKNSFLSDDQRINVALTRAKYALYIIGSSKLFLSCDKFGKIRKDAESRKLLKNLNIRMPLSEMLNKMIFM